MGKRQADGRPQRGKASGKRVSGTIYVSKMTPSEQRLGWVVFALYLFVFPFLMGGVVRVLDEELDMALTPAQSSALYYALVLVVLVAAFWEFLWANGQKLRRGGVRQVFPFAVALAVGVAGTCLISLLPLPVTNPVRGDYPQQFALSPVTTVLVVVFLRPAVEELLFRGLLFGAVGRRSRVGAYALSAGVFALSAVWQYALPDGGWAYLSLAVQYLPMGLALTWALDMSGSIYVPIAAHGAMDAIFLALAVKGV